MTDTAWQDPLQLDSQLSADERLIRDAARRWCEGELAPRIRNAFRHGQFEHEVLREAGSLGMLGGSIKGYGCP